MRTYALTVVLLMSLVWANGQKEAAIWYFGDHAGLDFGSGEPRVLLDGRVRTAEGCDSYSDPDGNLLFYTDGTTIWNRNHEVMENSQGLMGSPSSSQAALVVPRPGTDTEFFVFTPDDALAYGNTLNNQGPRGFNYSVVDMAAAGGLGAVTLKNQTLLDVASENVSAIRNFAGDFYWVVTHRRDRFYAYRLSAAGLDPAPVISITGPDIMVPDNYRGCAKISPDGTQLAIAHTVRTPAPQGYLYLYDFDPDSGVVSNPLSLGDDRVFYGVEFSPDSSKLYAAGALMSESIYDPAIQAGTVELVQFNLTVDDIRNSAYRLHSYEWQVPGEVSGSLQLAIDRRIYHSLPGTRLSVIRAPNDAGINADFREFQIDLGGRSATYGLPAFLQSYFETVVDIGPLCYGSPTRFLLESVGEIASVSWDFGDPASGAANQSAALEPEHAFSAPGTYQVRFTVNYSNGSRREFLEFVEISTVPSPPSTIDLYQCDNDGVDDGLALYDLREAIHLLNGGNANINAFFFGSLADAQAGQNHLEPLGFQNSEADQLIYARVFESPQCYAISEIRLRTNYVGLDAEAGRIVLCADTEGLGTVSIEREAVSYYVGQLFPGEGTVALFGNREDAVLSQRELYRYNIIFRDDDPRQVWFRIDGEVGCGRIGAVAIDFVTPPILDGIVEVDFCGEPVALEAPGVFEDFLWDDGSADPTRWVDAPGVYRVDLRIGACSRIQEFRVNEPETFRIESVDVADFRASNSVEVAVSGTDTALMYSLDGGRHYQETPRFLSVEPGVYTLVVAGQCSERTVEVLVGGVPNFFSPNGDGINDAWELANPSYFGAFEIRIFDRYGNIVGLLNEGNPKWDGNRAGDPLPAADYWYRLSLQGGREVRGHFSLIR